MRLNKQAVQNIRGGGLLVDSNPNYCGYPAHGPLGSRLGDPLPTTSLQLDFALLDCLLNGGEGREGGREICRKNNVESLAD